MWSGLFIPDPNADFLPSRIPDPGVKKVPNPGSRIRNTGMLLNIWVWEPGSEIQDPEKSYSGSRGQKGTGSRIRNTAINAG